MKYYHKVIYFALFSILIPDQTWSCAFIYWNIVRIHSFCINFLIFIQYLYELFTVLNQFIWIGILLSLLKTYVVLVFYQITKKNENARISITFNFFFWNLATLTLMNNKIWFSYWNLYLNGQYLFKR